jgi:hypothetical protein
MKPVQIGLLVIAGAVGGAFIMKVAQRPQPAPVSTPADVPATAAAPVPSAVPEPVEEAPSPFPEKEAARHHARSKKEAQSTVAQSLPPAQPQAAPATPAPEPVKETPPPAPAEAPRPTEPVQAPAPPPPPPTVSLAAGTLISVRLVEGLSTDRNQAGDQFTATLTEPVVASGFVLAERGSRLEGKVVESEKAGKVKGLSSMGIVLTRLNTSDGQHIPIRTDTFTVKGPASHGTDAAKVGGGAALGAIIGAIAGGGKGAGIGAGVGGAAGAGDVLLTRGKPAVLATETHLRFRLSEPVSITERN